MEGAVGRVRVKCPACLGGHLTRPTLWHVSTPDSCKLPFPAPPSRLSSRGLRSGTPLSGLSFPRLRHPTNRRLSGTPFRHPINRRLSGTPFRHPINRRLSGTPFRRRGPLPLTRPRTAMLPAGPLTAAGHAEGPCQILRRALQQAPGGLRMTVVGSSPALPAMK